MLSHWILLQLESTSTVVAVFKEEKDASGVETSGVEDNAVGSAISEPGTGTHGSFHDHVGSPSKHRASFYPVESRGWTK